MKGKPIQQKNRFEKCKEVWILKRKDGNIIDTFRVKATARQFKKKYKKLYLGEIILERSHIDNSIYPI